MFRKPEEIRKLVIEGLAQASVDCMEPQVLVRRKLYKFLDTELDQLYPPEKTIKLLAHPIKDLDSKGNSILSIGLGHFIHS